MRNETNLRKGTGVCGIFSDFLSLDIGILFMSAA